MINLYQHMKNMLAPAEAVGDVREISMDENFIGMGMDRVHISGNTSDGRKFDLTLEISKKEGEKDAD